MLPTQVSHSFIFGRRSFFLATTAAPSSHQSRVGFAVGANSRRKLQLLNKRNVATSANKSQLLAQNASQQLHEQHQQQQQDDFLSQQKHQTVSPQSNNKYKEDKYLVRLQKLRLWTAVDTIKRFGFRLAQLDALELSKPPALAALTPSYALVDELRASGDLVQANAFIESPVGSHHQGQVTRASDLLDTVVQMYVKSGVGLEFAHMNNVEEIEFLTTSWELLSQEPEPDNLTKYNFAKLLLECETFDHFLAAKFPTTKRYGLEGAETLILVLQELLRLCTSTGTNQDNLQTISDVVIGAPHRGRLNLMCCLLGFKPAAVFAKIRGEPEFDLLRAWMSTGDVLSHLSLNARFVYGLDKQQIGLSRDSPDPINVTLLPNPSHLEVASPLAVGVARGRAHNMYHNYSSSPKLVVGNNNNSNNTVDNLLLQQATTDNGDVDYASYCKHILPIQLHGDASFAGQGVIQETLQMSKSAKFSVGGSLHIIVNNQIGFTTDSQLGRSSQHCTDILKMIDAPIIHVNAENVEAVVKAARLALMYRTRFNKDVALDLICYRRHGHNEMDDPSITQPAMYNKIKCKKSVAQSYADNIKLTRSDKTQIVDAYKSVLQAQFKLSDSFKPDNDNYRNFNMPSEYYRDHLCSWQTGFDIESLRQIALASVKTPHGFVVHPTVKRAVVDERLSRFGNQQKLADCKVDWATAELMAFGSLLLQNHSVRLAGQDVARGTFSTRHAKLFDLKCRQAPFVPLNNLKDNQKAKLEVANTILSEEAALACEYGFSIETCELTIWEAQFGDFFNTAQSIIDTLVSCGEKKWLKQSPLTILLPHGIDGMGPEHSSGRIERFLQNSLSLQDSIDTEAQTNWSVAFPTLPSQYFHLLRRQIVRPFRKPLILMAPKVIFRHPNCVSDLKDFGADSTFQPVLNDPTVTNNAQASAIDTLVLCSGKVYFALNEQKHINNINNVALIRIEELCPFPVNSIAQTLKQYENVDRNRVFWLQEEHKNQGAFNFVDIRLKNMLGINLSYIGRLESEMPATGSSLLHKKETEQILKQFNDLRNC